MTRRETVHRRGQFFPGLVAVALVAAVLGCADAGAHTSVRRYGSVTSVTVRSTHPNVVIFLLDDANTEDIAYMPQVQARLVDRGVTFTNFYSPNALCCPARATLLTGRYSHNTHVVDNYAPLGGMAAFDDSSTLATWLTPDYRTALVGKYLNQYGARDAGGHTYVPPGWDFWRSPPTKWAYNYTGQHLNANGVVKDFTGIYSTTLYGNQARAFIGSDNPQPFFLDLAFLAPHNGYPHEPDDLPNAVAGSPYVAPVYQNTYTGPSLPVYDTSVNEADLSDKRFSYADTPLLTPTQMGYISDVLAQRREALHSVDNQIAAVMDKVAAIGEAGNTYYILASDNGYFQGQHRVPAEKGLAYQADTNVPLVIAGPGLPHGATVTAVSGLQDIAPTVLSMTNEWGSQHGAPIDGMSLLGLANGGTSSRAQLLETAVTDQLTDAEAAEVGAYGSRSTIAWETRSIVTSGGWKLTTYPRTNEAELYNLNSDPYEEHNLGRDPTYDARQAALAARLTALKTCSGADCRN